MSVFSNLSLPRKILLTGTIGTCSAVWLFSASTFGEVDNLVRKRKDPPTNSTLIPRVKFFQRNLAYSVDNIRQGRYHTLLTASFTHVQPLHFFFNMVTVRAFGSECLYIYGPGPFITLWAGSALLGSATGIWWDHRKGQENVLHMGASTAAMGLLTAMGLTMPKAKINLFFIPLPTWTVLIAFPAVSYCLDQLGYLPMIGHMAHVGGMGFGALYWVLMLRGRPWQLGFPPRRF